MHVLEKSHTFQFVTTNERKKGSVTLDNEQILRYMGEIQIMKRDLPADEKVNRVARVI